MIYIDLWWFSDRQGVIFQFATFHHQRVTFAAWGFGGPTLAPTKGAHRAPEVWSPLRNTRSPGFFHTPWDFYGFLMIWDEVSSSLKLWVFIPEIYVFHPPETRVKCRGWNPYQKMSSFILYAGAGILTYPFGPFFGGKCRYPLVIQRSYWKWP